MILFNDVESAKAAIKAALDKSDYTQLPDVNISNKSEFAQYRVALRSMLVAVDSGQLTLVFPTEPEPIWITE